MNRGYFRNIVVGFLRFIPYFNTLENELLTENFFKTVQQLKEKNSKIVFNTYYLPRAINTILKEENYLVTPKAAELLATSMMFDDLSNGTLTEFYRFQDKG